MSIFSRAYSLRKSTKVLRHAYHLFLRKKKKLANEPREKIRKTLEALQEAILSKNRAEAAHLAQETEALCQVHLRKTTFDHVRDLVGALAFALVVAILVRQMWFEFYEIPTGSMRPTLKEQDRLAVSKTNFGINLPLQPKQIYFDPALAERSGIAIFTGENMDIRDVDTMYFYLFPGKKQYVKRMIGKPGDVLYFYGGMIYGMDEKGNDVSGELQLPALDRIEHIPFIDFERKVSYAAAPSQGIFLYQMNEPVAKLYANWQGQLSGEVIVATGAPPIAEYFDLWGMKNYGMTRLLTKEQVQGVAGYDPAEAGVLYLEIKHHPSLKSARLTQDEMGHRRPTLGISTSVIPLQEEHLRRLFDNLYTARFCVKDGMAYRWGSHPSQGFSPTLADVPDGCYEFYYGKVYQVGWQGITTELPKSHPLYHFDAERLQLLYNVGIEFDLRFAPQGKNQRLHPARYVYFRNQDLYLLGAPIITQDDPTLMRFVAKENSRLNGFVDAGAPLKADGTLDRDWIRQYGIRVPPQGYLMLGDNHAMSGDSREFGFVPESNLRGAPEFIFWPPGARWGVPNQPSYPWIIFPRVVVWCVAAVCIGAGTIYWRSRNKLPLKLH